MHELNIGGKSYPCRVTMGAMVRFKRTTGKDVSEISEKDLSDLILFVWCCVASACKADGVAFDMDFEDFADCLEPNMLGGFLDEFPSEKKSSVKA